MQIDIIGVPIDLGADRRGVDMGPSAIRYAHLQSKLEDLGYTVQDEGNVEVAIAEMCKITDAKMKYIDCIIPMSRRIAGAVATSVQAKNFPLVLGGDHSLSIGSVRGAARNRKIGVIWIDAHADFNTAETTPSGNIHGMSLAILAGQGDKSLVQLWDESIPVIDPSKIQRIVRALQTHRFVHQHPQTERLHAGYHPNRIVIAEHRVYRAAQVRPQSCQRFERRRVGPKSAEPKIAGEHA